MQEVLSSKLILVVALGFLVILGAALFIQSPDAPPPNPSNTEDNCICIQILDPVCGDDGNTYGNPCMAECAGVSIAHTGDCSAPSTEIPTPSLFESEDSSESERPPSAVFLLGRTEFLAAIRNLRQLRRILSFRSNLLLYW